VITLCPTDKLAALDLILKCEVRPVTVAHPPHGRLVYHLEVQYHRVHGRPLANSPVFLRRHIETIHKQKAAYGQKD